MILSATMITIPRPVTIQVAAAPASYLQINCQEAKGSRIGNTVKALELVVAIAWFRDNPLPILSFRVSNEKWWLRSTYVVSQLG